MTRFLMFSKRPRVLLQQRLPIIPSIRYSIHCMYMTPGRTRIGQEHYSKRLVSRLPNPHANTGIQRQNLRVGSGVKGTHCHSGNPAPLKQLGCVSDSRRDLLRQRGRSRQSMWMKDTSRRARGDAAGQERGSRR